MSTDTVKWLKQNKKNIPLKIVRWRGLTGPVIGWWITEIQMMDGSSPPHVSSGSGQVSDSAKEPRFVPAER